MRLLDTYTLQFHWVNNPADATYMILSHVWDKKGEQTYQVRLIFTRDFEPF